ncbi:calvin cycle protein CP12-3, chloroplastic [Punica granatum]|uniref:Calvin cycle protein CP12-3, chloroplastic n=2 Tax=Punica granatum TaxID=22663 RepID=A0A6P8E9J7_PUNGR|nr:calvin cycle protein CP12-3, chloroplastic [Punica granatum]PKI35754.1 hypothetical protein CRG98_043912 [Punica granatum]
MASSSFNMVSLPSFSPSPSPRSGLSAFRHVSGGNSRWEKVAAAAVAVKAMAGPKYKGTQMRETRLAEMIEQKVDEAKEVCEGDATSDECKVAWDEVEEVSQAKADLRLKLEVQKLDPLESFCQDNPETEECRIYED